MCGVFCVKQKTAYEMRISDWSSDVCPSDLQLSGGRVGLYPSCFACRDLLGVPLGRLVQLDPERSSYYVKRMNSLRIPCRTHEWLGGLFERAEFLSDRLRLLAWTNVHFDGSQCAFTTGDRKSVVQAKSVSVT